MAVSPDAVSPISARLVICLGLSQLVGWGTMHYLIAVFGQAIRSDFGWSSAFAQSGFSLALVVMGLTSGLVGRWIDAHGGRAAMMAGCWIGAAGCALLATTQGPVQYFCGWLLLGLAMRLSLYDAAFASLAHVAGGAAKRAMSQITLFGGLASTAFWPLGQFLLDHIGWRGALGVYTALLLLASCLHFALPLRQRGPTPKEDQAKALAAGGLATKAPVASADQWLFGFIAASVMFMQLGLAAHFIELLRGADWDAATAVGLASVFGLGQFTGRVFVVAWAWRIDAIRLNLLPASLLCGCFALYLLVGGTLFGAAAFAFFYGTGNGIATVTRGAMPLLLFDTTHYGRIVGAILKPAFMLAAAAPIAFAWSIGWWGHEVTVALTLALSIALLGASIALAMRHRTA
ncbi:MAG: MFS transporter [Burkholderiales bacterium]